MEKKTLHFEFWMVSYYLGLSTYILSKVLLTSNFGGEWLLNKMVIAAGALCVLSEAASPYKEKADYIVYLLVLSLSIILIKNKDSSIIYTILFAVAGRNLPLRRTLKIALYSTLIPFLIVIISSRIGLVESTFTFDERARESLGFGWVTFPTHYLLDIAAIYFFLRGAKLSIIEIGLFEFFNAYLFMSTNSRNSFILLTVLCLLALLLRRSGDGPLPEMQSRLIAAMFPIAFLGSFLLLVEINPYTSQGAQLNAMLSNRILLTREAISTYGVSLLGEPVQWVTQSSIRNHLFYANEYMYVDNSYINLLINHGIVVSGFFMTVLTVMTYRVARHGGLYLSLILCVFAIHSLIDPQLLDLYYCGFLVLLGCAFVPRNRMGTLFDHKRA